MSGEPENNSNRLGQGNSLSGGPAEALPAEWAARASSGNSNARVGRIGEWSSSAAPSQAGRVATLRDLASAGPPPGRSGAPPSRRRRDEDDDEDDDDDDEDPDQPQNFFAGGERSALSVENPNRPRGGGGAGPGGLVKDILRKASQAPQPEPSAGGSSSSPFFGSGNTLGSDDVASRLIPDPSAPAPGSRDEEDVAIREITFWQDGFTIHDGPLLRYEVPENARILEAINAGNAPPSVLNVRVGQPVELRVARRTNEAYVEQPKPSRPFEGEGNRLGSVVPEVPSNTQSVPGSFPESRTEELVQHRFQVDQTLPTTSVQVRLADGTRLVCRMNLTHNVGDIRNFINASRPDSNARPYVVATTFPNRTLDDDTATIEKAGLQNSVVVQRWA